jgi:hypothetical protein
MQETVPGNGRGHLAGEGVKEGEDLPIWLLGVTGADRGLLEGTGSTTSNF